MIGIDEHTLHRGQRFVTTFCNLKNRRGLLRCLRKNPENLTEKDKPRLESFLVKQPAIRPLYKKQLELRALLKLKTLRKESVIQRLPEWLSMTAELKACPLEAMTTLGNTLESWSEEIIRMWRFTRSNGITEGFYRKIKLIQRRAYGFRNFENYSL